MTIARIAGLLGRFLVLGLGLSSAAHAALTVTPIAWNIIGLDSNSPTTGPQNFPVGARVCSNVATTNVSASLVFDSANANVNLRPGSLGTISIASIAAGACSDAYFEVQVTPVPAAYDTTRRYHVSATDGTGTYSSPTPRELYVEHLVSQARNAITDVKYGTSIGTLQSVPAGGSMNLIVGNTYVIQLLGGTATQGYNQFEAFINFSNTIFQILSVNTTYSADNSPYDPNPNDKLYADACRWDNDPNSPTYRNCVGGDFKAGGSNVVSTYTIKIIGGGGTSQTLNTLLYDFSGSSFHYNGDYSAGARIANVIDPTTANISKAFSPNPMPVNGTSALTITLTNPNAGALGGYNFTDPLPAGLVIATPSGTTASGCGTPTLTAPAGGNSLSFSNGTVAANGSCVIKVNVTASATGSYVNTTNHLFIDSVDTGHTATSTLTVDNAPPPGTGVCGTPLASWRFPTGFNVNAPAATVANVAASASPGAGLAPNTQTTLTADGSSAWGSNGSVATGATLTAGNNDFFQFALDTTGLTSVQVTWNMQRRSANGPQGVALFVGSASAPPESGTQVFANATAIPTQNVTVPFSQTISSGINAGGTTFFRIYAFNSGNTNPGSDPVLDDVVFSGCSAGTPATISKAFAPNPIVVNGISTLTFTLTNPNGAPLTGAAFSDALPSGVQVAATPVAATTCGGTWMPAAGNTTLTFSGGTIPASSSCTVSVNVTATTAGPHANIGGFLSTTETGTNTSSVPSATLIALSPPSIAKSFVPSPIVQGGVSTLTFTITNPNPDDALASVAFNDTFPVSPGAMVVASPTGASTSGCGAPTFAPIAGAATIALSGATLSAGGICTVTVRVIAPSAGNYNNTSGNVSTVINGSTVNGNTASASLVVNPPNPAIGLLKQVSLNAGGPWTSFVAVSGSAPVYYQFTVENLGDSPLSSLALTDNTLDVSSCNTAFAGITLPVAVAANNNHIITCVVGPVATASGVHVNVANVQGTFSGITRTDQSTASYATTGLTLDKSSPTVSFTVPGDTINYSYLVTNSGFAPLADPVTVSDDKTTVTCPSTTTVGDLDAFLDPGESLTCTATYIATAGDVAAVGVTNIATAHAGGVDSNTDSVSVPLSTSADVSVVKTLVTAGPYYSGESIGFTLVIANAGPSTATNLQVTDTPTNLTITGVSGSGCAALPCTIASLASGGSTTINLTATINAAGAFDNSATASASQPDPDLSNNTDNTGNGGSTSAPLLNVTKSASPSPFVAGQSGTYTITIANAGSVATSGNITVTDNLAAGITLTNASGTNWACVGSTALTCTFTGTIAPAASTVLTLTVAVGGSAVNGNNSATASGGGDPTCPAAPHCIGTVPVPVTPVVDVSMVKTLVTTGPYVAGQTISYTLVVGNAGPSTATGIQVTDTPTNLTISGVSGACTALPCTIPSLVSGASVTITVTATINAAGAFDNVASAIPVETDGNLPNNTDSVGNSGVAGPSGGPVLNIAKSASPGLYAVGQPAAYTITVSNAGSASSVGDITVSDTLPAGITLASATGTNWSCAGTTALNCTFTGTLAAAASTALTLNVLVGPSATTGTNTAIVAGGGDPSCPAAAHCTATVPVAIATTAVPALDMRSLVLLALALAAFAGVASRRHAH